MNSNNPSDLINSIEEFTPLETTGQPVEIKMSLTGFIPLETIVQSVIIKRSLTGFTLTELIITLVIVGTLAAIGLPKYGRALEKSRQTEAITILAAMRGAQIRYYVDNSNNYVTNANIAALDIELPDNNGDDNRGDGEFFDYSVPPSPNDTRLARAIRNNVNRTAGEASYELRTRRDGVVFCDSAPPSDSCVGIP